MKTNTKHIDDWLDLARKVEPCMSVTQLENLAEKSFSTKGVEPGTREIILNKIAMMTSIFLIGALISANQFQTQISAVQDSPENYQEAKINNDTELYLKPVLLKETSQNTSQPKLKEEQTVPSKEEPKNQQIILIENDSLVKIERTVEPSSTAKSTDKHVASEFSNALPGRTVQKDSVVYLIKAKTTEQELNEIVEAINKKGIDFEVLKVKRRKSTIRKIKLRMDVQRGELSNTCSKNILDYHNNRDIMGIEVGYVETADGKIDELILRIKKMEQLVGVMGKPKTEE